MLVAVQEASVVLLVEICDPSIGWGRGKLNLIVWTAQASFWNNYLLLLFTLVSLSMAERLELDDL